jgi:hypothetical protein
MMFSKLSILFFYIRYFKLPQKMKMAISATIIVIILYSLLGSFEWVLLCRPIKKYWDLSITRGSCLVHWQHSIFIFSGAMNTTTDITILLISISMLHGVWLTRQEKIALVLVMTIGGLYAPIQVNWVEKEYTNERNSVILVSVIRLKIVLDTSHKADMTWDGVRNTMFWWARIDFSSPRHNSNFVISIGYQRWTSLLFAPAF